MWVSIKNVIASDVNMCHLLLNTAPTAAPVNLSLHAVTPTTLLISWEPPPLPEQNGEIIEYTYYYSMDGTEGNITEGRTSELEALLEGLQPFRLYFVYVAASTQVGMGPLSAPSLIEMPQDGRCSEMAIRIQMPFLWWSKLINR